MKRRVVVTGLGTVGSLGLDTASFWDALAAGRPGIRPIETVDRSILRFANGAEAAGFQASSYFEAKEADLLDRFAQFAIVAAAEALRDAGMEPADIAGPRTAVVLGTSIGGQQTVDDGFVELYRKNNPRGNPLTIARTMPNAAASMITMRHGITGPAWTVATACSSSNHALGQAFWAVRDGLADRALSGGSEAPFNPGFLKAWEAMRVIAPDTCRPFSLDRKGIILGEGAGILVLETLDAARARGARIYAEIAGFGMSSDAHHITQPSADGAAAAIRMALDDASLPPEAIGYINAHGTGTAANDVTETRSLKQVFGTHASRLAVSSTKSMHGHALGAAGALEAVATSLALYHGLLPPTANYSSPDPECDLDVLPNAARHAKVDAALSNSFAFGGLNAVLAFRSPDAL